MLINTSSTSDTSTIVDLENNEDTRPTNTEFDVDGLKWKIVLESQQLSFTLLSDLSEFCSISMIIHCTDFVSSSVFTSQFERCGESVVHEWLASGQHVQLEIDQTIHETQFSGLDFSSPFENSDALLRVEDEEFHVHTFLLSLASQFFQNLFADVHSSDITRSFELKGISSCSFRNLLNCLYGYPHFFRITRGNIAQLLELGYSYEFKNVLTFCEYHLCNEPQYNIRSTQKMEWAIQYNLESLKNQLLHQEPDLLALIN